MLDIQNKIAFENNLWLGTVDASNFNSSEDARIKAVTDLASITKGRLGFKETPVSVFDGALKGNTTEEAVLISRTRLYSKLLIESAGKPSTPFEFIPVRIKYVEIEKLFTRDDFNNDILKYSYTITDRNYITWLLTNMRTLLKAGIKEENIPFNTPEEVEDFKIIVGQVPYEVIKYLGRKSAFSLICELDNADEDNYRRYLNEVEFWYPSWWEVGTVDLFKEKNDVLRVGYLKGQITHPPLMKPGEAIMELSDRRLVKFAMCAWKKDSNAWDNLFTRNDITSPIVKLAVDNIKKLII